MSQPKLMVDNKDVQPAKKVKLYREIKQSNVKIILENTDMLEKLKQDLQKKDK